MQLTLFKALQSIRIDDDAVTAVVDRLEEHVVSVVSNNIARVEGNIARVEGELVGIKATLEALKTQITFVGVMIGIVGLAIAAGPLVAKLIR